MTRLVFVSCLLLTLSSCGVAGLALSAASYKYVKEKGWFDKKTVEQVRKSTWYQIHEDGIWYGDYVRVERTVLLKIYGNPRDKDLYE